ncbi:NAD-dependent epimerase/dehydratase family protein [Candidatus Peregrinibacteria bacterium]|nr:NAD-dependent epimerase/dehydratase family protein [Candidatus Peregrinibacteria bacterium]MBI3816804.1 NAD-dependent epimerase/dehydratase family protein [Candidatus Peregrinibacteria bacterium]
MRVLVTGSSGTIGTRLCEKLLERGQQVCGVDWVPNRWQQTVNAVTTTIDLRSWEALERWDAPTDIDAIVHLAANARVYELVEHPNRARDNFLTLFTVLEFARERGIKRVLFASSRECYGNADYERYTEDLVRVENCESPYTASKLGGEAFVHAYTRCYGIDHVLLRFSNVYGMYDDSNRVIPLFIRQARANEPLTIFGEGKCLDFTHIDDTVAGIIAALDRFETAKNDTYNIAYGEGTTILKLAEDVIRLTGSSSTIAMEEPRTGEVIRYIADISKAKRVLGYDPKVPFEEGIRKTVEWYQQHS